MIRKYAQRAGIKKRVGCHTLRHSFALNFYKDSGHDLIRLQKILGHKSLVTTEIYCYIDSTDVKEGLEAYYSKRDLKDKNIEDRIKDLEKEFDYPLIIKTITGSKGRGGFLLEDRNKLNDLANLMEISKDPKINLILQEFISSSRGRDIRVIVLGGRVIGAMLRTAVNNNFKANYSAGGVVAPFGLNPVLEWLAIESSRLINLDIAGVDFL